MQTAQGPLRALRRANRDALLGLLSRYGPLHRAELARRSGLSRTTVSTIVTGLLSDELIMEVDGDSGAAQARPGRPGGLLMVNPRSRLAVGMDFSYELVRVIVADLAQNVLGEATAELGPEQVWADNLDTGVALVDQVLKTVGGTRANVVGVGVGVPGPIDGRSGEIGASSNSLAWAGVRAADELAARLDVPVVLDNTSHLGALAEVVWGAGIGCRDLLFVKLSMGVGSGLVFDGRIFRGNVGAAGEIGHITMADGGPACRCGNRGCLEVYAGVPAVLAALRPVLGDDVTLPQVLAAADAGNRACTRVLSDVGEVVGRALAGVCNLLNPERIVVGGHLAGAGEVLLEPLRAALRRHALAIAAETVQVVPAALGEQAGALGGVALVLREGGEPALAAAGPDPQ